MTLNDTDAEKDIEGVFAIEKTMKIGTGTTARRVKQQVHFYAKQQPGGLVRIQPLNADNVPFGPTEDISKDRLLSEYLPVPERYKQVMAKLREIQKAVARGDKFRKRGETFTAEYEYNKALSLDEQNVRANFGVGICYMARGEEEKAREVFERVLGIDAAFGNEHKHLFNEYGMRLRKAGMIAESVDFYNRALELTTDDENLYYNLARAELERKDMDAVKKALARCLRLNPEHAEARKVLAFLKKKKLI
jgi:tetratricopeptide (TPR) repeat protein